MSRESKSKLIQDNERLYSHHSDCKERMGHEIEIASRWRIRAFVAEKLLSWMNSRNPFWYQDDLKKEIDMHSNGLFEMWKRREPWWEEMR